MSLPAYFLPRPPIAPIAAAEFAAYYAAQKKQGGELMLYSLPFPKWQFLCWLTDTQNVLLHGSGRADIKEFEPRKSDDIEKFGDRRAVYAASDGIWPLFFAILDRAAYKMTLLNASFRVEEQANRWSDPFYFFSVSREALVQKPWKGGFIYLLPRGGFEPQPPYRIENAVYQTAQWASLKPVKPLARIAVGPEDFPFLTLVRGHNDATLWDRAAADPTGFPWTEEETN